MTARTSYADGAFCWVDLMAHDIDVSREFYCQLFDWTLQRQDTQGGPAYYIFKHASGQSIAGFGAMPEEIKQQDVPPFWKSYVNVDDITTACEGVEQLGGTITMPIMPVMQYGTMAGIADPAGANVMLWQKGEHFGAELVNDVGAFCWNELATRDIEGAQKFYGELFGWQFERSEGSPSTYFNIKNAVAGGESHLNGGMIEMTEQWGDAPPHWMVYFSVADADAAIARIIELGGSMCVQPFDVEIGRIAIAADPEGGTFSIIQMNVPPD